jgi:hypothetical protein
VDGLVDGGSLTAHDHGSWITSFRPAPSPWARAIGVQIAGIVADARGDFDHGAQLHAESAQLARELGDSRLLSIALNNLGNVARRAL